MITPGGEECRFYYEDFHRGRSTQECRLLQRNPNTERWKPSLCSSCPVPDILKANASPFLALEGKVTRRLPFRKRVEVFAVCSRHLIELPDPYVGCSECRSETPGTDAVLRGKTADE